MRVFLEFGDVCFCRGDAPSGWNNRSYRITAGLWKRNRTTREKPSNFARSKARTNSKLNRHMTPSRNWTRAILVMDERALTAPSLLLALFYSLISPKFSQFLRPFYGVKASSFFQENKKLFTTEWWSWDHWKRSKLPLVTRVINWFLINLMKTSQCLDYITEHDLHSLLADSNKAFDLFSLLDSISDCRSIHAMANILNSE